MTVKDVGQISARGIYQPTAKQNKTKQNKTKQNKTKRNAQKQPEPE
jgi:hypothetical protein